jgi:hypothetical protein
MTEPRPSRVELDRLRGDYEAAKAKLTEVGLTCEGSLIERYTTCHNPKCRCSDPEQRHSPYWRQARQDRLPAAASPGRPALPGMDRQPPPA